MLFPLRRNIIPTSDLRRGLEEGNKEFLNQVRVEYFSDEDKTPSPARLCADPLHGCRPKGSISKFWVLNVDNVSEDDDDDFVPSTLEMVRHAAVHGLSKEDLVRINSNLDSPTFYG